MSLTHPPGQAQCDLGEALVVIGAVQRKAAASSWTCPTARLLRQGLPCAETTETFLDGHVSAFAFLGGVPQSVLYDNTRLAVAKILGDGRRQRTRSFTELQSHYLFDDRFGRPGKGNDKGRVEGLVGYARRNFLVPIPSFESFEALNACLERRCLERMDARLREHSETIGQRMERDLDALLPLPSVAYDACDNQAGRVSSLSLVRYRTNDYSVPVAYGHRDVIVRGYVDQGGHQLRFRGHRQAQTLLPARRLRLRSHPLPAALGAEDRCLGPGRTPARMGSPRGVPDAAKFPGSPHGPSGEAGVCAGAPAAGEFLPAGGGCGGERRSQVGAISFDAVKHLVLSRLEGRPPRLDLELYPYLPRVRVSTTSTRDTRHSCQGGRHDRQVHTALGTPPEGTQAAHLPPEYGKLAAQCAAENVDHPEYLLRLAKLELIDRHQGMVERRIRAARFPAVKSLDTFDFPAIPSLYKALVMELARCEYIERRENVIAVGNSGIGKTRMALGASASSAGPGRLPARDVRGLHHRRRSRARDVEARDERRLLHLQRQMSRLNLLIIDEPGVSVTVQDGSGNALRGIQPALRARLLHGDHHLPFDEWTEAFGSERLTGALLDRLTHHVHILEMNGVSFRLKRSRETAVSQAPDETTKHRPHRQRCLDLLM